MNMMNWKKLALAAVMVCLTVGAAHAQPGGGGGNRGRGGPGGFPGFGGGFGGGNNLISLSTNEAVQKEIAVTDAIKEALKEISDEYNEERRKARGDGNQFANFRDMSEEERTKAMEKMNEQRRATIAKFTPDLKEALTAEQFKRLSEINVQAMGVAAYSDPDVVKALGLSKEQQDKVAEINKTAGEKMREAFQGGRGGDANGGRPDFQAMRTKMDEMNKDRDAKLAAVLTKDQEAKFKEMKGKEFDIAQLQPRGFGGPGAPGGRPGADGQGGRQGGGRPAGDGARPQAEEKK